MITCEKLTKCLEVKESNALKPFGLAFDRRRSAGQQHQHKTTRCSRARTAPWTARSSRGIFQRRRKKKIEDTPKNHNRCERRTALQRHFDHPKSEIQSRSGSQALAQTFAMAISKASAASQANAPECHAHVPDDRGTCQNDRQERD